LFALKQAGFFVRPCILQGAPHYWMNDPVDEPGSHGGSPCGWYDFGGKLDAAVRRQRNVNGDPDPKRQ
jgi:hypothetical protein